MYIYSFVGGELVACVFPEHTARRLILASMYALHKGYSETGWRLKDPEEALAELEGHAAFVFVGDKVICLTESQPWFSDESIVSEEFVTDGIHPVLTIAVIKAVCGLMNIRRFAVGTRAVANERHAGLAKLYQRDGLTVSAIELSGVVHGI